MDRSELLETLFRANSAGFRDGWNARSDMEGSPDEEDGEREIPEIVFGEDPILADLRITPEEWAKIRETVIAKREEENKKKK